MELSEERKRQIREEEEARLRAERQAEDEYREQVRRELEERRQAEIEQQYREQVRAEFAGQTATPEAAAQPAPADVSHESPQPAAPPASTADQPLVLEPPPRKLTLAGFVKLYLAAVVVLGGLACAGMAFSRGFTLPFTGPPGEITLRADPAGDIEEADYFEFDEPEVRESKPTDGGKPSSAPPTARSKEPVTAAAAAPRSSAAAPSAPAPTRSSTSYPKRAILKGSGISVEVPEGWVAQPSDYEDMLEIGWRGTGIASGRGEAVAYFLLQKIDLRLGDSLEDFAKREMEQFEDSLAPDQRLSYENEDEIRNFHGVRALTIDVVMRGDWPYRMRNIFFIKGGKGYLITCYATAGSYADRAPTFDRMLKSIKL